MLQKKTIFQIAVLAAGVVFLMGDTSEAQRKQPGGRQRQGGRQGGRGGFGQRGGGGAFGVLGSSEYLQKELNLTSAQKKRMQEINIQISGTRALLQDDVANELGLSESQKEKISEASRAAFQGLFGGRGGNNGGKRPNFEELRKKFTEAREKADKEVLSVLTKSQQAKFEKMKGKPIDREKVRPQGGPGRRPTPKRPNV